MNAAKTGGDDRPEGKDGADTITGEARGASKVGGAGSGYFIIRARPYDATEVKDTDPDYVWTKAGWSLLPEHFEIARIVGRASSDVLLGTTTADQPEKNADEDILRGYGGDDPLFVGEGDDQYIVFGNNKLSFSTVGGTYFTWASVQQGAEASAMNAASKQSAAEESEMKRLSAHIDQTLAELHADADETMRRLGISRGA